MLRGYLQATGLRIRAGDTTVDLHRSHPTVIEHLGASGRLSPGNDDDFADFPTPGEGQEPLEVTMEAIRGDR